MADAFFAFHSLKRGMIPNKSAEKKNDGFVASIMALDRRIRNGAGRGNSDDKRGVIKN
jgi:hypothetical protein